MERRWSERKFVPARVTIHSRAFRSFAATLRDLSLGGAFIETTTHRLPLNEPLVLSVVVGGEGNLSYHRVHAMVVRAARDGAGVMHLDPDARTIGELRAVLAAAPAAGIAARAGTRLIVS